MDLLRQVIYYHKDGIVSFQVWEFSDHIHGDHLPVLVRDLVGDQLSTFCIGKVFVWLHVLHPVMNLVTYLDSPGHQ